MRAKSVCKVATIEQIIYLDKKRKDVERKKESKFNKYARELFDEIKKENIRYDLEQIYRHAKEIFVYTNWRGTPIKTAVIISIAVALGFVDKFYSMMLLKKHRVSTRDMNKLGKVEAFPYVDYIANKVADSVDFPVDLAVRMAKRIIAKYRKGMPIIVAASAFYLAAKAVCKKVTQKAVSDVANVSDVAIRYSIREMKGILEEMMNNVEIGEDNKEDTEQIRERGVLTSCHSNS